MAIVLTRDTVTRIKRPIGIKFPLVSSEQSFFQQNYSTEEQRKDDFFAFFSTKQGERVMQPTYGSRIHSRLFEPNDQDTSLLRNIIEQEISVYLPWAVLRDVEFFINDDNNMVEIKIFWSLTNDNKILETNIAF